MIDTKELRRLAQAAIAKMNASDPEFASSTPPLAILELLDRLEAAERERDNAKKLADVLAVALNTSNHERANLRAKIEQMTKRLRTILEEPKENMSNSKALREMVRQARLALEESK